MPTPPIQLYYNPRCSKCRTALQLLRERGIEPELITYLDNPPGPDALSELARKLGGDARRMLRTGEALYESIVGDRDLTRDEALDLLASHPSLLERPIATSGDRAVIARPPERVLELLA